MVGDTHRGYPHRASGGLRRPAWSGFFELRRLLGVILIDIETRRRARVIPLGGIGLPVGVTHRGCP
jgi:hypothetical protein